MVSGNVYTGSGDYGRLSLIQTLNGIPQEQLLEIIFTLNPPSGIIPLNIATQGKQVFALLQWAKSPYGCGLEQVQAVLDRIIKPATVIIVENPNKNTLSCVVTGGINPSDTAVELAKAIGYKLVKHGHILLNGGAEGIDKAAAEGANEFGQELKTNNAQSRNIKIIAYRPKTSPQIDYNHLFTEVKIVEGDKADRRDVVVRNADAVILLSGSKGTRDIYHRALNYKKVIIPVGCSGGEALNIWHEFKRTQVSNNYIPNKDIDCLNPLVKNGEKINVDNIAKLVVDLVERALT